MAEDKKDVPFDAPWVENLRHRPDPNRVGSLQTDVTGRYEPGPLRETVPPGTGTAHARPALGSPEVRRHDPQSTPAEPSYYDVPMLKQPVWKWQIATYFYLGGLSAGAYVLGRMAERAGGRRYEDLTRVASYVAMAALVPSPPLLIWDLGDPKRFHHMLRVWKPGSPMNLGTWSIVAYSGVATYEVVRQYLTARGKRAGARERNALLTLMNNGVLLAAHDAAGIPFALMVAGYTGVLLSCTSNPLWCKNPWLGPLFSASAIGTGAEAVSLALDCTTRGGEPPTASASQTTLRNVDTLAHAAEMACMAGFMKSAGEKAHTLRDGRMSGHHRFAKAAIVTAEVLKRLPVGRRYRKPVRMVAAALGLAAGFSTRWSMVFGGHAAAADPHTARLVSRPDGRVERQPRSSRPATSRRAIGGAPWHVSPAQGA